MVDRIDSFKLGIIGGIEKSKLLDSSDSSQGFHIDTDTPNICMATQKQMKIIRTDPCPLMCRRNSANGICQTPEEMNVHWADNC